MIVALLLAAGAASGPLAHAQTLAQKEATLLARFRSNPEDVAALTALSLVREARGDWSGASATWALVNSKFGTLQSPARHSDSGLRYRELAQWWQERLARRRTVKQALGARRQAAARSFARLTQNPNIRAQRTDMDGDGLPEIAYFTLSRPDADGALKFTIASWRNGRYETIWLSEGDAVPITFRFAAGAWPAIYANYPSQNGEMLLAGLRFNGDTIVELEG
ncbi:MAG TPA: hypothetical protein VF627_08830 [Abditibacterium sp.]